MMIDRLIMPPHYAFQLRNVEDYFIINVAKKIERFSLRCVRISVKIEGV